MRVQGIRMAKVAHPTGDPNFSVMQPFPAAVSTDEADPFLMCDFFGPSPSEGLASHPDEFPINWHPHRGMDIATYLIEGRGRHGDSMGNREEFDSPGMQWCSVGSGIEHAEGGGTPVGQNTTGFQLWINVPSARKMDDPRYGTVSPDKLPLVNPAPGVSARVLAGALGDAYGPFVTVQSLQMVDYILSSGASVEHIVPANMDNAMVFAFEGSVASCNGSPLKSMEIAMLDARDASARSIHLTGGSNGGRVMLFAGKRLNQPVAWRGPFVMTTQAELTKTFAEYRSGNFPPVRVPWDYRKASAFPTTGR
jgi:redox-sensitive bicupin YhaK (pirin superfamily)